MKRAFLLASAAGLALAGFSAADTAPSSAAPAVLANVKAGEATRMVYELEAKAYVLFIPATGRAHFDVEMRPDTYNIKSRVKVTGIADWFVNYDMHLQASGYTRGDELKTYNYVSQNRDGKKNRRVNLTITDDDFSMTANPVFGNLGEPRPRLSRSSRRMTRLPRSSHSRSSPARQVLTRAAVRSVCSMVAS